MVGQEELDALKAGYAAWGARGREALPVWRAMMGNRFVLSSMDAVGPGMEFARDRASPDDALAYMGGIFEHWDMVHYTPQHYVCEGDSIAMFGTCAYRNKATGKLCECRVACLWRFEDGKAVELTDIFDTARAVSAATPD